MGSVPPDPRPLCCARAMVARLRDEGSAAADLRDQIDLAVWLERGEIGILKDFAMDRDRPRLFDLAPQAGIGAVELKNQTPKSISLNIELGDTAGEPARCLTRDYDMG